MRSQLISIGLLSLALVGCGDGDFRVNPSEGTLSSAGGGPGSGFNALQFFTIKLYPLMIANTGSKSCLGSGCHSMPQGSQTYFQVDASSADGSFNWARPRRLTPVVAGDYSAADPASSTLKFKKDQNHQNFNNWTNAEKTLIDEWSALPN